MKHMSKFVAAGAVAAATILFSAPASAATIVKPVASGVFNLANPIGTVLGIKVSNPNTYDFTFTLGGTFDVIMQLQASMFGGVAQNIDFSLYSGAPGSGTLLASSAFTKGPAIEKILGAGSYYLQIGTITVNRELVSGSLTVSAIPEPATWALMISGFGLAGAAIRRRRASDALA